MHPILARFIVQNLREIFSENRYADKVIEHSLRSNPKAGSRDRAFIAEHTYGVVRYYRLYSAVLDKTPQTEADFWLLLGIHFRFQGMPLPTWREFATLNALPLRQRLDSWADDPKVLPRALRESIPDWLDATGAAGLAAQWDETLAWLNKPADVVLRTNTLRTSRPELQKALEGEQIETRPVGDGDALLLIKRKNVFQTKAFRSGWFEVQDYSSQLVAPLLAPAPGMRVVDACAGGGGKTLHLAALMQNKGSIIALDTLAWKLDALRVRARRAGVGNIETRAIESSKTIKRLAASADRLLLDVPCSGLGVLRRNPDSKWKLSAEQLQQLHQTQREILRSYSAITKPGGRMVYATCSILPSENEQQVAHFLNSEAGQSFRQLDEKKILPQDMGFDGFYMALFEKNG